MSKHNKVCSVQRNTILPIYKLQTCYDDDFENAISLGESFDPWPRLIELANDEVNNAKLENIEAKMVIDTNQKTIKVEYASNKTRTTYFASRI